MISQLLSINAASIILGRFKSSSINIKSINNASGILSWLSKQHAEEPTQEIVYVLENFGSFESGT